MRLLLPSAACAALGLALVSASQEPAAEATTDERAVRAAIEDYVLAFYEAEPERLERALAPGLRKLGWWNGDDGYGEALHMSFEEAVSLATVWNAEGQQGDDLTHEISLHEVCDKTAAAHLTAFWGQDEFHLAEGPDGWRIHHVMWQSAPVEVAPEQAAEDESAVRAAVEDYVIGFLQGETDRLERALDPEVAKLGWRWKDGTFGEALPMTRAEALALAATRRDPANRNADQSFEITVFDVRDKTASVKLTAYWGQDYFHLAKGEDGWAIHNVIWQSAPRDAAE